MVFGYRLYRSGWLRREMVRWLCCHGCAVVVSGLLTISCRMSLPSIRSVWGRRIYCVAEFPRRVMPPGVFSPSSAIVARVESMMLLLFPWFCVVLRFSCCFVGLGGSCGVRSAPALTEVCCSVSLLPLGLLRSLRFEVLSVAAFVRLDSPCSWPAP